MDDKESETNTSSFPLFNLEALKQGFPHMPNMHPISLNIPGTEDFFQPTEIFMTKNAREEKANESEPVNKKRGRKPKRKSTKGVESPEATMKDILENEFTGIPMEADVKMKEQKLVKMREGKAKKKKGQTLNSGAQEQSQRKPENVLNMQSVAGEPETLFGLENSLVVPAKRVVIKDGKPVLEDMDSNITGDPTKRNNLTVVANSKPQKVSSMSFKKRNHTKQWTPEETRKFYKALELFGTEFSLISKLFPSRDRAQMKNKLRKEEKENPVQIDEAFKKHEASHKKPLISRIGRAVRKQLKADSVQLPDLENFGSLGREDSRYRSISNCSLDSTDMRIVDDLKGIFTQEILPTNRDPFNIQGQLKREALLPEINFKSNLQTDTNLSSENPSPDSMKENRTNEVEFKSLKPLEKEHNPLKNNLLLGLLKK